MRFGWVGCHVEGLSALEALLAACTPITGVITLRPELAAQRSGAVDYAPLCVRYGIPLARVGNINEPDGLAALRTLDADVVFVIGWSQILRPAALQLARTGMIGAHASLLPQLRGSAPINWALIRGERQTGNSLIWLAQDVDRGAIIDQTAFCITPYDTCATLYASHQPTGNPVAVTNGSVGNSGNVTFDQAGTYYWQGVYTGDTNNNGATSVCASGALTDVVSPSRLNLGIALLNFAIAAAIVALGAVAFAALEARVRTRRGEAAA